MATYKCPKCGGQSFAVSVEITHTMAFTDSGSPVAEYQSGDPPYWDGDSFATCINCDYQTTMRGFRHA